MCSSSEEHFTRYTEFIIVQLLIEYMTCDNKYKEKQKIIQARNTFGNEAQT